MSRPFILDPLFRNLKALSGVGPRTLKHFERLINDERIFDLLAHKPIELIDRSYTPTIAEAEAGRLATIKVQVLKHTPAVRRNLPYRVRCKDDTGTLDLVFFRAYQEYMMTQYPIGEGLIVSGKIDVYRDHPQIVHPELIGDGTGEAPKIEPVYPLTQGISHKVLLKALRSALGFAPKLPEWLDPEYKKKNKWPDWNKALETLHAPQSQEDLDPNTSVRSRLAYDECLANQLTIALMRHRQKKLHGISYTTDGPLKTKLLSVLPFSLTGAQIRTLKEIDTDISSKSRMMRLLQGDVGSGKTIVAALSMMNALDSGMQAAMMAPTEILARQHYDSLKTLFEPLGIRMICLTGRNKGKERDILTGQIKNGAAQIIIGTHALFQDSIEFQNLGFAVIDEQHRFGVDQRLKLSNKGKGVDVLVMTATPIPRTLALTSYGDLDVSVLDEKPPGRKPIDTLLFTTEKIQEMIEGLKRQIEKGARIYWVCPLVEESNILDVTAAEERFQILESIFGEKVGLIHGRMKPDEKDTIMQKFMGGDLSILVATTVIEVGVNVPEATIMVIESAERFGLAQLHQLRGRVGRGGDKSYCFLLYKSPLSQTARERLSIMRETEDGFLISEKDLELRGSGDVLGTKQSGVPEFKFVDLAIHGTLLAAARDDAKLIIQKDVKLTTPRGEALRTLLYLYEGDQAIQYLQGG
ncbi:MAG: ATP-dependent DNA helicase RecG [Alphaproteobacteria bacterium]|nr:ATP-dependent DNA helicase RecG [Alphaproteobacteria bacterium]